MYTFIPTKWRFVYFFRWPLFDLQKKNTYKKPTKNPFWYMESIQFPKTLTNHITTFYENLHFAYYYTYKKTPFFATIKVYKMSILPLDPFSVLCYVRACVFYIKESVQEKTPSVSVCKRFHSVYPYTSTYIFETIILRRGKKPPLAHSIWEC
jgi:hypothetical protein